MKEAFVSRAAFLGEGVAGEGLPEADAVVNRDTEALEVPILEKPEIPERPTPRQLHHSPRQRPQPPRGQPGPHRFRARLRARLCARRRALSVRRRRRGRRSAAGLEEAVKLRDDPPLVVLPRCPLRQTAIRQVRKRVTFWWAGRPIFPPCLYSEIVLFIDFAL